MRRDRPSISSRPLQARNARAPASALIRLFVLATMAVIGSSWAIVRFYTSARTPTVAPIPSAEAEPDAGPRLIPAPEIEVERK
jgi:hypothetical protein